MDVGILGASHSAPLPCRALQQERGSFALKRGYTLAAISYAQKARKLRLSRLHVTCVSPLLLKLRL